MSVQLAVEKISYSWSIHSWEATLNNNTCCAMRKFFPEFTGLQEIAHDLFSARRKTRPMDFLAAALVLSLVNTSWAAGAARDYPSKPIRIIVMNGPGSGPDIVSRVIGIRLTEAWGQQIVIDNRAGANGIIGAEIGARAAPDGYTLLMVTSQAAIVDATYEKLNYDLVKDFSPISLLASTPFAMVINPSVPATSIKELIALAKAKPGEIQYGSTGSGSPSHLATEIFKSMSGIDLFHVPYKAVSPALTDTMAGQVQLTVQVVPSVLPMVKAGKLRALGVTSLKRTSLAPDWPAISESVAGYEFMGWYGLVAPARTSGEIISKLNAELIGALKTAEFRERLAGIGAEPSGTTPQAFAAHIRAEVEKMRKAAKAAGVRADM
jgi:tripartite-type tricarboxylate transporter receptor subunit TctC